MSTTMTELSQYVHDTWTDNEFNELRIWLGLTGELGEMAEKTKKFLRDSSDVTKWRKDLKHEIGDLLFYIFKLCDYYDLNLDEIVALNKSKLKDRKERDVIQSEGDYR